MKKLTILLFTLLFGAGTLLTYGQEAKVKEGKAKTETTQDKKATAKKAKKQKETPDNKGKAYGKNKETTSREFGQSRSNNASKGKKK
jgi:hypothetical protein